MDLAGLSKQWSDDLHTNVIPFWSNALDTVNGGYNTCLDINGTVLGDDKYMWLQGRGVWMYSRLYNTYKGVECIGSKDHVDEVVVETWFENAQLGARFLEKGKRKDNSLLFAVSATGTPLHFQRKPYAAVFYVLACLEYGAALKLRENCEVNSEEVDYWFSEAEEYFDMLRTWIDDPTILNRSGADTPSGADIPAEAAAGAIPRTDVKRASSLADVMCLASLAEELLKKIPSKAEQWMLHVVDAQSRVSKHYNAEKRVFMEVVYGEGVSEDGFATFAGRVVNPGHSIEVAWFLLHLCEISPSEKLQNMAFEVLEGSLELGWVTDS